MRKLLNNDMFTKLFPVIILPVSTTIISLLISRVNREMGLVEIVLSILSVFIVLLILCVSANIFMKKTAQDIIKSSTTTIALEAIKIFEEKQRMSQVISEELLSLKDIYEIEKCANYQGKRLVQVDIIATSFNYDISDEYGMRNQFRDIVVLNTNKDIVYNFYVTDNPESLIYATDLSKQCKKNINIFIIDKRFFLLMKDFDFSIYHLEDESDFIDRVGFMSLSNLLNNGEVKHLYHVMMADAQVKSIISILPDSIVKKVVKE